MGIDNNYILQNIDTLILDIDHVINHYDSKYAQKFSVATASSFWKLHPTLQQTKTHDFWIDFAVKSYQKMGRTTAFFADEFKIDEMELYVHHHDYLCETDGFIQQQFNQGKIAIDHELPALLKSLKQYGIKIYALTNGTEGYAKMVLGARGHDIADIFDGIMGMDSFDNQYMSDKRHGAFISDALDKVGVLKRFNSSVINRYSAGDEDFDHSNVMLIDDTHRNLKSARFAFNIQTILQRNNPNIQGPSWSNHISCDFKETLRDIITAKSQPITKLRLVI